MKTKKEKNIIFYVGGIFKDSIKSIREFEKKHNKKFRIGLIHDSLSGGIKINQGVDIVISCDVSSSNILKNELSKYKGQIVAITCRGEKNISFLQKVIALMPELNNPTVDSLSWTTNKIQMRKKLLSYDKNISPLFMTVNDFQKKTLKKIEDKVGYPLVVKPAGLQASLLVSICFYREELENTLKLIYKKIDSVYKEFHKKDKPGVLVEQFMEGEIYSTDAYINKNKEVYFTPFVHAKNGRSIGFDDFFEYQLTTPSGLNNKSISTAELVAKKSIKALNLFNSSAHIELMKTEKGWKVIELGPRIGGWRNEMYEYSYGINHVMNDILNKMGKKPIIFKKVLAYTTVVQFYTKKEGILKKISGIKKIQNLESFKKIKINKKLGDMCRFAKNGGKPVFYITLSNKNKSELLGDVRRAEQATILETK